MPTVKQKAVKSIEQLPDDCTMEDIFEKLLFLEKIREGKSDAQEGNLIDHEEVEKKFSKFLRPEICKNRANF